MDAFVYLVKNLILALLRFLRPDSIWSFAVFRTILSVLGLFAVLHKSVLYEVSANVYLHK